MVRVMTPEELQKIAMKAFGQVGWSAKLSHHLGIHPETLRRWKRGHVPIPQPAALAVRALSSPGAVEEG
jgi:DNA-binding transcriptional regulator YdaS (Cro superfamily)